MWICRSDIAPAHVRMFGVVVVQALCKRSAFVGDTSPIMSWPGWHVFRLALRRGSLLEPQMFERMRQIVCVRTAVFVLSYLLSVLDVYTFMTLCTGLSIVCSYYDVLFRKVKVWICCLDFEVAWCHIDTQTKKKRKRKLYLFHPAPQKPALTRSHLARVWCECVRSGFPSWVDWSCCGRDCLMFISDPFPVWWLAMCKQWEKAKVTKR